MNRQERLFHQNTITITASERLHILIRVIRHALQNLIQIYILPHYYNYNIIHKVMYAHVEMTSQHTVTAAMWSTIKHASLTTGVVIKTQRTSTQDLECSVVTLDLRAPSPSDRKVIQHSRYMLQIALQGTPPCQCDTHGCTYIYTHALVDS